MNRGVVSESRFGDNTSIGLIYDYSLCTKEAFIPCTSSNIPSFSLFSKKFCSNKDSIVC
jgi:hypothetical protein